jgi:hypothetical protein
MSRAYKNDRKRSTSAALDFCRGPRDAIGLEVISHLRKLRRLTWRDRLLLVEAVIWLAAAGFAITFLPFRHFGLLAARPVRLPTPSDEVRLIQLRHIRWAIITTARRVPWHALCIQQGLAAQFMLRRRGIPSVLYYGAAQDKQGQLIAHVWVRDGDINVIGGEIASRYAILTTFPHQDAPASHNSPSF